MKFFFLIVLIFLVVLVSGCTQPIEPKPTPEPVPLPKTCSMEGEAVSEELTCCDGLVEIWDGNEYIICGRSIDAACHMVNTCNTSTDCKYSVGSDSCLNPEFIAACDIENELKGLLVVSDSISLPIELKCSCVENKCNRLDYPIFQLEQDTYFPVTFLVSDLQKTGQTFLVEKDSILKSVTVYVSYSLGEIAYLNIYQLEEDKKSDPEDGTLIYSTEIDLFDAPRGEFLTIELDEEIELEENKYVGFVISVPDKTSEIGVGKISYQNLFSGGTGWYFTRKIGGNGEIIDPNFSWNQQGDELAFIIVLRER